MGVPVNDPNSDYRLATAGADDPSTGLTPLHWYSGASQIPKAVVGGLADVGTAFNDILGNASKWGARMEAQRMGISNPLALDMAGEATLASLRGSLDMTEDLKAVQKWATLDPRSVGAVPQVLGSTARGLTIFGLGSLLGGPEVGATVLGTTEGQNAFTAAREQGADTGTAAAHGVLTGVLSAAGAVLPFHVSKGAAFGLQGLGMQAEVAGRTALADALYGTATAAAKASTSLTARLATGAVVNTGFGMANRFLTSELLDHAGYKDMAQQYKVMDSNAIVSDAVLGLAFGGLGYAEEKFAKLRGTERPDPAMIEQALDARRQEMIARGAAGLPTDPATAALDHRLQEDALTALIQGKDVNVAPKDAQAIVFGSISDPEKASVYRDWTEAGKKVFGFETMTEPKLKPEEPVKAVFKPVEEMPVKPPVAEGATQLDPMMQEHARQLAQVNPDLDVHLPDGRTVKADTLDQTLQESLDKTSKTASWVDAAVGCFLRGML